MTPRVLYKRLALAEVVTWTLLILGMIGKYGFGQDWATSVGGGIHGFVFLCYVVATLAVLRIGAVPPRAPVRDALCTRQRAGAGVDVCAQRA